MPPSLAGTSIAPSSAGRFALQLAAARSAEEAGSDRCRTWWRSGASASAKSRTLDPTAAHAVSTTRSQRVKGATGLATTGRGAGSAGSGGVPAGSPDEAAVGRWGTAGAPSRGVLVAITPDLLVRGVTGVFTSR